MYNNAEQQYEPLVWYGPGAQWDDSGIKHGHYNAMLWATHSPSNGQGWFYNGTMAGLYPNKNGASIITTLVGLIPESAFTVFYNNNFIEITKWLAKFFIAMAMAGIGLNNNIVDLIKNGGKPILLGLCCWVSITAVSLSVQSVTGIYTSNI